MLQAAQGDIGRGIMDNVDDDYALSSGNLSLFWSVAADGIYNQAGEKVGNIPCLGNVNEGFDKEKIKKLYVEDFIEEAKEYCKECWAVNLCTLCYVNCYDANGLHLSYRHKYLEDNLRRYHALMEAKPSELEQYNEMEIH